MSERLVYVMDPMCSWCWGFAPVVEALAAQAREHGVALDLVVGGLRQESTPISHSSREKILTHWQAVAQTTGQPFTFADALADGFIYDTTLACQALVAARTVNPALVLDYARVLQEAFYIHQAPMNRARDLVLLAEGCGLDASALAHALDDSLTLRQTRQDFAWAERLGVVGFPTLLAERKGQLALLTNGYQPLTALAPLLTRWLAQAARA